MDYDALKSELATDPANLGYADKTPDEILALLKTTSTVECFVPLKDLQSILMETVVAPATVPAWWVLKAAAATNPLAEMAFDLFNSRLSNLNTRGAFQASALAQLQQAGLIDQGLMDAITAMSFKTITRGELLFGSMPTILEIQLALL